MDEYIIKTKYIKNNKIDEEKIMELYRKGLNIYGEIDKAVIFTVKEMLENKQNDERRNKK